MEALDLALLQPLEEHFGFVGITYGFAGPDLVRAIRKRAAENLVGPNIAADKDQHAGHELNSRGKRICRRDGFAVDLLIPDRSSFEVAIWIEENLPFDRMYLYGPDQPLHLSWAPAPVGHVIRMGERKNGRPLPTRPLKRPLREELGDLVSQKDSPQSP